MGTNIRCRFGIHKWRYLPNVDGLGQPYGGRPMVRQCARCAQRQCWDYDQAMAGFIGWKKF